ncbi:Outer membrane receptor protein [Vibrio ichthyoenteri ATCC 700023]|uniref:Outer membrane receptor protein n=1 Tax=Vibrio ichthyoenteri ATCC 700023 TaxID=870968 RepID=F9S105_9VIBR|nr:outer membrane beta-barrel protein [Vibrio ichthyoenteri]EGU42670.1 Outer membrane receptor protein [Vibrio ichthyoenteri ATCC 700023]
MTRQFYLNTLNLVLAAFIFTALSSQAFAASRHSFYGKTGVSTFKKEDHSQSGLYFQGGYNFNLTPFLALDLHYTRANSFNSDLSASSHDFTVEADGVGAGVKLEHYIGRVNLLAKTGVSALRITEEYWDSETLQFEKNKESITSPYIEVGIGMMSPWTKNLNISLNYNYQLANDVWDISTFSLNGHYSF